MEGRHCSSRALREGNTKRLFSIEDGKGHVCCVGWSEGAVLSDLLGLLEISISRAFAVREVWKHEP